MCPAAVVVYTAVEMDASLLYVFPAWERRFPLVEFFFFFFSEPSGSLLVYSVFWFFFFFFLILLLLLLLEG